MYAHRPYITASRQPSGRPGRRGSAPRSIALGAAFALALTAPPPVQADTFACGAGDVLCLKAAISQANTNGDPENTIFLEVGTYSLTAVDNNTDGPNGLPSITSSLKIIGAGAEDTVIERQAGPGPDFRLLHVAGTGDVTLKQLTLRGGRLGASMPFRQGAGLFNAGGIVTIIDSTFTGNATGGPGLATSGGALYNADGVVTLIKSILSGNSATNGGGIWNTAGGSVTIRHSTIANNLGSAIAGGIFNEGTVTIIRSSLSSNQTFDPGIGGGIENFGAGTLTIVNSTISGNSGRRSGGIANLGGTVMVTNSTISDNSGQNAGGIDSFVGFGVVALQNTILALNSSIRAPDCSAVTSLGNNLIGTTTNCDITIQPSDLTGDPGLDTFTDDGTPGNGHYPLLPTSQAIDAGNDAVCPKRDQIGQRRHHPCDIGAIEFPDRP